MIDILLFDDQLGRDLQLARSAFAGCSDVAVHSGESDADADADAEHVPTGTAMRVWVHSGQRLLKGGFLENSLPTVTRVFMDRPPCVRGWALVLVDVRFDSGLLHQGSLPAGCPGDELFGSRIVECLRGLEADLPLVYFSTHPQGQVPAAGVPYLAKLGLDTWHLNDALLRHGRVGRAERRALLGLNGEVVESPGALAAYTDALKLARLDISVLITGETGTGKELLAQFLHRRSFRAGRPFVSVNMAAVPAELFEATFLGHERGAFTGAAEARQGLFEQAHGGTLFLDELGELPEAMQAKLLRVLQDGCVRPLGATRDRQVDVRLLSATNRGGGSGVRGLREDLFQRVSGAVLHMPPLRERAEDVLPLAIAFLNEAQVDFKRQGVSLSQKAIDALRAAPLPGNVRELRNRVRAAVARSGNLSLIEPGSLGLEASLDQRTGRTGAMQTPQPTRTGPVRAAVPQADADHAALSLEEVVAALGSWSPQANPDILRGALVRLDEGVGELRRKLASAALAATRHPASGRVSVQAAMQLLTNDLSLRASAPRRVLNGLLGRAQKAPLDEDTINRLLAESDRAAHVWEGR